MADRRQQAKRGRRRTRLLELVLVAVLVACSADADTQRTVTVTGLAGHKGTDVTVWLGPTPTLHPHIAPAHLTTALFSRLVTSDPTTHLPSWGPDAPGAMLQAITTQDLRSWQLVIKDGWRWHDGSEVVAADLQRGWQAAIAAGLPLTSTITDVQATDATTLAVTLAAPFGQLPHLLTHQSFLPLPPLAETSPSRFAEAPIGTGPYQLVGREAGAYQLQAVDGHPLRRQITLDRLRVHLTDAPGPEVDLAVGADGQALLSTPGGASGRSQVLRLPGRQLAYLAFPLTDRRFADPDTRHALALAIDTRALADEVMGGDVVPADRLVGPGFARAPDVTCGSCRHDATQAAALWPTDFSEPLTVWFAVDAGHQPVIDAIAEAWSTVLGVENLQLASLPADDLVTRLGQNEVSGPFRLSWQADVSSPARLLTPLFGPRGGANDARYRSPEVAELLRQAGLDTDLEASLATYGAAEMVVLEDLPIIPLWFSTIPITAVPDISGIALDGEGRLDWTTLQR